MCFSKDTQHSNVLLYLYEADFMFLKKNEKKLAQFFNFLFSYLDDVLSLNKLVYVDCIYLIESEGKDTTDSVRSASFLDI
jgi:hypothetical protein